MEMSRQFLSRRHCRLPVHCVTCWFSCPCAVSVIPAGDPGKSRSRHFFRHINLFWQGIRSCCIGQLDLVYVDVHFSLLFPLTAMNTLLFLIFNFFATYAKYIFCNGLFWHHAGCYCFKLPVIPNITPSNSIFRLWTIENRREDRVARKAAVRSRSVVVSKLLVSNNTRHSVDSQAVRSRRATRHYNQVRLAHYYSMFAVNLARFNADLIFILCV